MAPQSAVPPSLPPSIEEAYRRKCVQLKTRTNEVEDANDAARLRLARIKRQVEKLRIERAFLLEQLAKRTSTNVEDSEGSPSPPPTPADYRNGPDANPRKPKDKPLRLKRGHRKSAANDVEPKAGASKDAASPASESQSQRPESQAEGGKAAANYAKKLSKLDSSAFEVYCRRTRHSLESKDHEGDMNVDEELVRGWEELPEATKADYRRKVEDPTEKNHREKTSKETEDSHKNKICKSPAGSAKADPNDDEMVQYESGEEIPLAEDAED